MVCDQVVQGLRRLQDRGLRLPQSCSRRSAVTSVRSPARRLLRSRRHWGRPAGGRAAVVHARRCRHPRKAAIARSSPACRRARRGAPAACHADRQARSPSRSSAPVRAAARSPRRRPPRRRAARSVTGAAGPWAGHTTGIVRSGRPAPGGSPRPEPLPVGVLHPWQPADALTLRPEEVVQVHDRAIDAPAQDILRPVTECRLTAAGTAVKGCQHAAPRQQPLATKAATSRSGVGKATDGPASTASHTTSEAATPSALSDHCAGFTSRVETSKRASPSERVWNG